MMAKLGSKNDSFATIDLKSASDTISLNLCRHLFPASFYELVSLFRTKSIEVEGKTIELHMMSTMGNGFTFPLQTIIFQSIVLAVYRLLGITPIYPRGNSLGNFSVFGDDIIVLKSAYETVIEALKMFGFIPNEEKSFGEGLFRESCGGDYYNGHFVRGVYNKTLRSPHHIYSTLNLLVFWSARHNVYIPETIKYLRSLVRWNPIPIENFSVSGGVMVPSISGRESGICYELNLRVRLSNLRRFERHYPNGLFHAALKGALRDGKLTERLFSVKYHLVKCYVPNWDYVSDDTLAKFNLGGSTQAWRHACEWYYPELQG